MSSKGGHSAKDEEKDYTKYMIEFEGKSIDYRTIINIDTSLKVAPAHMEEEFPDGVMYSLKLAIAVYPFEDWYHYATKEERDFKEKELKQKMEMINTTFL